MTDQKGNLTSIGYDSLGRKSTMADPDMGAWAYLYDPNGNLVRQTDSRGQRVCFFYDALNRLTGKQHNGTSDTCPATPTTITYSYDAFVSGSNYGKGRQTGMTSPDHSVAWKYNARGQIAEASHTVAGVTRVFNWAYDSADRLRTLTYPAIGGNPAEQVTYTYDAGWRPTSLCAGATCYVKSAATWTALGQPDSWTLGNNLIQDWTYASPMQRLQRLTVGSSGLFDRSYTYDNVGNVRSVADAIAGQTYNYRYDHRDRLTRAWLTPGTTPATGQALLAEPQAAMNDQALIAEPEAVLQTELAAVSSDAALVAAVGGESNQGKVFGQLPLTFTPNMGQVDPTVQYLARGPNSQLFFTPTEIVLAIATQKDPAADQKDRQPGKDKHKPKDQAAIGVVRIQFEGANPTPAITVTERLAGSVNYIKGDDPARWQLDVPTYSGVIYQQLYPGIDLVYTGSDGRLKGTYQVAANTDPGQIRWRYHGAEQTRLAPTGELRITVPVTYTEITSTTGVVTKTRKLEVTEQAPVAWQVVNGEHVAVPAQFTVSTDGQVGFALGSYDPTLPVIIDPVLTYSTYLGGSGGEAHPSIAVDSSGNMYITGYTTSIDFPTVNAYDPTKNGSNEDIFVAKLNAAGTALLYSTYLGGTINDVGYGIAVDSLGNAHIVGQTGSSDFPQLAALPNTWGTNYDNAILARLNSTGELVYSTYLGGNTYEYGADIVLDGSNGIYVTGNTNSLNFPIVNAVQPTKAGISGGYDAFVAKLQWNGSTLSFVFSTYLGGAGYDVSETIGVDTTGSAYVAGHTDSGDFPMVAAYDSSFNGPVGQSSDVFVTKFAPTGNSLVYSTYLGGGDDDTASALAVDVTGSVYVAGYTVSNDYPVTSNHIDGPYADSYNGIVSKLTWSGSAISLSYSTYIGGSDTDYIHDIAVDTAGSATITGLTYSPDFPTVSPTQATLANASNPDAFVSKLVPNGTGFDYSTCLGGTWSDVGNNIALDATGSTYVAGSTNSTDYPLVMPLDSTRGGTGDIFVAKLSNLPDDSFTYDELGNLTTKGGTSYSYGANGNATGAGPHQARSIGGQTYSYDAAGNLLSGGGRTYTWNAESRLTQVVQGGLTETYGYDGHGERVKRVAGSVITISLEGLWEERLGTGGTVTATYSFGELPVAVRTSLAERLGRRWDVGDERERAGQPAGAQSLQLRAEQPGALYRFHWALR